jgi:hypothetical protein
MSKGHSVSKALPEMFRRDNMAVIKVTYDRDLSKTTLKNQEAALERRRRVGPLFDKMTKMLNILLKGHTTLRELRRFAIMLDFRRGLNIDRQAKRSRDNLICWFCEHFPHLLTDDRFHQLDLSTHECEPNKSTHPIRRNVIPKAQHRPPSTPIGIWCGVRLVAPPPFRDSVQHFIPSQIPTTANLLQPFDPDFCDDVADEIDTSGNCDQGIDDDCDRLE